MLRVLALTACACLAMQAAGAQPLAVTRAEAVAGAVAHGPRLAVARADSAAGGALLALARQFENPALGLSYSKAVPQQHYLLNVPLDYPWLRDARIGSARAGLGAATFRYAFEREAVAFDADTTYTRALASFARARLSQRTALDADSLLRIAKLRRDAGDASELDVQLALVNAGQLTNLAALDSLEAISGALAVQAAMGLGADSSSIVLADTLETMPRSKFTPPGRDGKPLLVAAAEADARAAELTLVLERRRRFAAPALSLGIEAQDPTGVERGALPTFGVSFPLPLFNQNRAAVAVAQAQRDRAAATLALARISVYASLARARRSFALAQERLARSERLLDAANRVASLSLIAYREGAAPLSGVLEAQRTARGAQAQYVDDLAAARNGAGLVRLLEVRASDPQTTHRLNP